MPNVVGQNLDTATSELDSNAIQYALNSNGEHVILKFDWGVCSTSPAAWCCGAAIGSAAIKLLLL